MVVLEFFGCLIVMFILWCRDERQSAVQRQESARKIFPTGYAIEYKVTMEKYDHFKQLYDNIVIANGYDSANEWRDKYFAQFKLPCEDDVIACYAIVAGREAALRNNRSPKCYNDGFCDGILFKGHIEYGYKKCRADLAIVRPNRARFDNNVYQKYLAIDRKTYQDAVKARQDTGCWNGAIERRFS